MSLKTWIEEYYTIPASEVQPEHAIQHSIKKWIGLRPENLERHGLTKEYNYLHSQNVSFGINTTTCALCKHYYDENNCENCPLQQFLGERCDLSEKSPYQKWLNDDNPEPMISALQQTLVQLKTGEIE